LLWCKPRQSKRPLSIHFVQSRNCDNLLSSLFIYDIPRAADVALRQKWIWTTAAAATAHRNCGRWQGTTAVEWDATGRRQ
jgi:hypothetical protein